MSAFGMRSALNRREACSPVRNKHQTNLYDIPEEDERVMQPAPEQTNVNNLFKTSILEWRDAYLASKAASGSANTVPATSSSRHAGRTARLRNRLTTRR